MIRDHLVFVGYNVVGDRYHFAVGFTTANDFWTTDGTAAGTTMLSPAMPFSVSPASHNGAIYLTQSDPSVGAELFAITDHAFPAFAVLAVSTTTRWTATIPVPSTASLSGLGFALQSDYFPAGLAVSTSNALRITLGR